MNVGNELDRFGGAARLAGWLDQTGAVASERRWRWVAEHPALCVLVVSGVGFVLALAGEHGGAGGLVLVLVLVVVVAAVLVGWWRRRRSELS